jgi:hypothetical protein
MRHQSVALFIICACPLNHKLRESTSLVLEPRAALPGTGQTHRDSTSNTVGVHRCIQLLTAFSTSQSQSPFSEGQ